jgi:hypothetical protein
MQISSKTFNALAVAAGLACTAAVWHHMATNPRWANDKGPGVGKLPREIVAGYLSKAYAEGRGAEAASLYMAKAAADAIRGGADAVDGPPLRSTVRRVVAEGLQVVVWHCIDAGRGQPALEVVDFYRIRDGRIVERLRPTALPAAGGSCATSQIARAR